MSHLIITGHSRGLGAALAENFLRRGFAVLGLARGSNPELETIAAALPEPAGQFRQVALDLADTAALLAWLSGPMLRDFLAPAKAVYLINNAGLLQPVGPLGSQDGTALARNVAVNVTAPMLLANAVVASSPAGVECRVLHISSGVGRRPCAGWSVYAATKAALDHHARSAALDHLATLRIASIAPGVVDTAMQAEIRASDPAHFPLLPQFHALKRDGLLSSPADCAEKLASYLTSAEFDSGDVLDLREMNRPLPEPPTQLP
jgi:hypothetical protein